MARRTRLSLIVGVAALLVVACGGNEKERALAREAPATGSPGLVGAEIDRAPAGSADTHPLADGLNHFGLDYYALLAQRSSGENVVFSPLSIGIAFGMADVGARGETARQIEDVFHLPTSGGDLHAAFNALDQALADSGKSTLRLANRMYPAVGYELVPDFVETLAAQYGAPLGRLAFATDPERARKRINAWVAKRTEKRIPELLPAGAIDAQTVLVLVNALYLEAKWSHPFVKAATEQVPFTRLDGSRVDVPLMHNARLATRYAEGDGYQAVELPYGQGELSMLVVVPDRGRFSEFERSIDTGRLAQIDAALSKGMVDLFLPRWSASFDVDLEETLSALGLSLPFDPSADFTGISPGNLWIGSAVHAADIEVDEWGTVAAAATALGFRASLPPPPDAVIRADRPFLYLIRDTKTATVLFLGRVVDPAT